MKILPLLLISLSGSAVAQPYFSCDVQKPCSETNVLGYCVEDVKVFLKDDKKAELVATVRKPNSKSVRPLVLSSKISEKFQTVKNGKTTRFMAGWDGYEHHITLYSNNGKNWGGRLTIDQDTNFRVQCTYSDYTKSTNREMEYVASKQMGNFYVRAMPNGFTARQIKPSQVQLNSNFRALMHNLVASKKAVWRQFVLSPSGKEEGYTPADALTPEKAIGVPSVLAIDGLYAIYKGDQFVGYVYDLSDYIQATIFQDGAGVVLYLNRDMELVKLDEWAA